MNDFFNNYFNIRKIIEEKREYQQQMARVNRLPDDYQYVFKKIQKHMWSYVSGAGYDMMEIHYGLIDLFEDGAASGRPVLEITGPDVAAFTEELLKNVQTYTENRKEKLNRDINRKFGKDHL